LREDGYFLKWNGKQNIGGTFLKINNQQDLDQEQILTGRAHEKR
jgi:hypothetical protein